MITGINTLFELDEFVQDYFFKAGMIFSIQMLVISFIAIAAFSNTDGLEYV